MTMPSTSARASGLLLWSFRPRLALLPFADISTGSATLQRSSFAVLGACGGHPKTRRCARPARWSTGRLRRIAELLTRGSAIVGRRCDQPRPGPPVCGPSGWRRSGRASSAGGARHGWGGAARHPRRVDVPPRGRPDTNTECRSSQGPCVSSVTPNPGTPMVAYGWWYARTGITWSSSGRTRPVPVAPCGRSSGALLGTFATACCSAPGQLFMRAGTASAAVAGPTPSAVPVLETGIDPRLVITS